MGDSVYAGSCNGMFRQLDARTGKVQWETDVRGSAAKYFFHGDVLSAGDRIIASADIDNTSSGEAGVHAFERRTDPVRSIGATDDLLFVGTPAGSLYAVRPSQTCR